MTPEERIDRYLLGQANAEDIEILNGLLEHDEELRPKYRFRVALEGGYREAALREGVGAGEENRIVRFPLRRFWTISSAIAAVVVIAFAALRLASPNRVATLVSSENAAWESELPTTPGSKLGPGLLRLKAGIATLRFDSGAVVVLEAPAQMELVSTMRGRLIDGAAVIDVPDSAFGFVIETPNGYAVDYGTRFAVRVVEAEGRSDFELIEGEIGVHGREKSEEIRLTEPHKIASISKGSVSVMDVGSDDQVNTNVMKVIRLETDGRATTVPPESKRHKFNDPEVLAVKAVDGGNGKWDYRSCFAFDLSPATISAMSSARLRLNLVPSRRGFTSRLPLINRFGVYGLTNTDKADWTIESIWESAPGTNDGVLLGTFEIPRSQQRGTCGIDGEKLLEFLKRHPDESVTFILVRETTQVEGAGRGLTHTFASDAHPEAVGPLLELTVD